MSDLSQISCKGGIFIVKKNISLIATVYVIASIVTAQTVTFISNKFENKSVIEVVKNLQDDMPINLELNLNEVSP